jgi:hypothetical protein
MFSIDFIQWMKEKREKRYSKKKLLEKMEKERMLIKRKYFKRLNNYNFIRFLHARFSKQGLNIPVAVMMWAWDE